MPHLSHLYEVAVGWDKALETYFLIVFGTPDADGDPEITYWCGRRPKEVASLISLQMDTRRFACIPYPIALKLITDMRAHRGSCWLNVALDFVQLMLVACSYLLRPMRSSRGKSLSSSARDGVGRTFPKYFR